jgi:hypothetical protein
MRCLAGLMVLLMSAAPAAAQAQSCEASVKGAIGEVTAIVDSGAALVSWAVEPRAGVGEESDHFARPGLLLDFTVERSGALDLAAVITSVTRYEDATTGRAPAMSRVRVIAKPDAAAEISWASTGAARGESELTKVMKARWPDELVLSVIYDGVLVAGSEFDLSTRHEAERMAHEALERCGR